MKMLPMSFSCLLFLCTLFTSACVSESASDTGQEETVAKATTYYLIRHAEKDLSGGHNGNPPLTAAGEERAEEWARYFKRKGIDAVYSTNYERTRSTATPAARAAGLEVQIYRPGELYTEAFQRAHEGKSVLIVGHSNTIPALVNRLVDSGTPLSDIDESEYGHLYTVRVKRGKASLRHREFD